MVIKTRATGSRDGDLHRLGLLTQMAVDCVPDARGDRVLAALRADGDAAIGGVLAEGGKPCSELLLKAQSHRFEPVLGCVAGKAPAQRVGGVHIHHNGDVRLHPDHQAVQGVDGAAQIAACCTLVHAGRIREPVADDHLTCGKGGADRAFQMIAASGGKQQNLSLGGPTAGIALNQQAADFFGTGGAAGLTGQDNVVARLPQTISQHPRLGGLTGPIDALKAYKHMVSTVR